MDIAGFGKEEKRQIAHFSTNYLYKPWFCFLSCIANTADDTNDNDDIFGTSFLPYKDNQQDGWSSEDDIIFQNSDDDVDSNSEPSDDNKICDDSRDDTDACAACGDQSIE